MSQSIFNFISCRSPSRHNPTRTHDVFPSRPLAYISIKTSSQASPNSSPPLFRYHVTTKHAALSARRTSSHIAERQPLLTRVPHFLPTRAPHSYSVHFPPITFQRRMGLFAHHLQLTTIAVTTVTSPLSTLRAPLRPTAPHPPPTTTPTHAPSPRPTPPYPLSYSLQC